MQYIIIAVLIGIAAGLFFAYFIDRIIKRNEPHKAEIERLKAHRRKFEKANEPPMCRCGDPNQCDIWCYAKAMFAKHHG